MVAIGAAVLVFSMGGFAQTDWPTYNHDSSAMRYSPLTQINPKNVNKLVRAWTYHSKVEGTEPQGRRGRDDNGPPQRRAQGLRNEATPIVVGNVLYLSAPYNRVVAIEADSGREIWNYRVKGGNPATRGVSYWPGDKGTPPRILFGTTDGRLIALNAKNGELVPGFGNEGFVNLKLKEDGTVSNAAYSASSPPTLAGDVVLQSGQLGGDLSGGLEDIRAWDIRTGKLAWRFHTIPHPGEPNYSSWQGDPKNFTGANSWGISTYDKANNIVFVPLKQPTAGGYYGGDRKGANLYGTSLVALNASTGKLLWYFQFVHHDIWDYDAGAAPTLIDIVKDGKKIQAVAEITKLGFLWILDRHTGKPIFGYEERPVPQSDVPGEETSPTQPFPLKPPALARQSFKREEMAKLTPEHQKACEALFAAEGGMHNDGPFTPYGSKPSVVFPGTIGGGNWGGVSFDPKLGYIFVNTMDFGGIGQMTKQREGARSPYARTSKFGGMARFADPDTDWPCQQPPWGRIFAINATTGDIVWQTTLGMIEELASKGFPDTGAINLGGPIATAGGLIFIGATMDSRFRAFDSRTGKEIWTTKIDASSRTTPITYQGQDGRQYVVITAGGGDTIDSTSSDSVIAFALPSK